MDAGPLEFFAPCARGLEYLLVDELGRLGAAGAREALAGVRFKGTLETGYRAVLWSRLASRVLLVLHKGAAPDLEALTRTVQQVDWTAELVPGARFVVDFTGTNTVVRHSGFGAQKVKDAIVDQYTARAMARPDVDRKEPGVRVNTHLRRGELTVCVDLAGVPLHERGYRRGAGPAPLKETLAAAMLFRAGWPARAAQGESLVDPFCGAGTIAIEAACMACDVAPGLNRGPLTASGGWTGHDPALWMALAAEARERAKGGTDRCRARVFAFDKDSRAVRMTEEAAAHAGVSGIVDVSCAPLEALAPPSGSRAGVLVGNPPYGVRMGTRETLVPVYETLGARLLEAFDGWRASIITSDDTLARAMRVRSDKQYSLYNGAIECRLYLFDIGPGSRWLPPEARPVVLGEGARALRNRLEKNLKRLRPWRDRQGIECYRAYDADLPEYAAAIDVYGDALYVQEYRAPPQIPERLAEQRLRELAVVAGKVFEVPAEKLFVHARERKRGASQYERRPGAETELEVVESGLVFSVKLGRYVDTGLFLDHRITREMLRARAGDRRFLNLFAYTGTASVYAAAGGAQSTTSVDLSRTYVDWARRNFVLNGLDGREHRFEQADAMEWLRRTRGPFDLIFVDPPTFSNSKRMQGVFDVQRDHAALLERCLERLAPGGEIVFSTNFRRFRLDADTLGGARIENWTRRTIPRDFERSPRIHQCWRLSR